MISQQAKEQFKSEPSQFIIEEIKSFARNSPLNRMPPNGEEIIFDEPLVGFADSDDSIFAEYKTIIGPTHLTPGEALAQAYSRSLEEMPTHLSVISWILPITKKTRESNRSETRVPSRLWSHTRWFGEQFNDVMRKHVAGLLTEMGYLAVAPVIQPYFKMETGEKGYYSNWSERHIAYAAGHGTFSLSDGFITERGIAHRCGSVVTNLVLPASPRKAKTPFSNCLFYFDGSCKICIKRCPAGAITKNGHDKLKCRVYLGDIGYSRAALKEGYDIDKSVSGCGLCQVKVPCEYQVPAKIQKKKA
jgi:epoxyqueuosine reductase